MDSASKWIRLGLLLTLASASQESRDQTSVFEVLITDLSHLKPTIYNGTCCEGAADSRGRCAINSLCNTYFRVCLQEFRRRTTPQYKNCTLGEATSEVFRGFGSKTNRFDNQVLLSVPIFHRWTETFTLVLDVLHRDPHVQDRRKDPLIDRVSYKANLTSSLIYQRVDSRNGKGVYDTATVLYRIRVRCAANHFTKDCSRICSPRDDRYGHWTCDENGEKKCLDGWAGRLCERPLCESCDANRSVCEAPDRCACRSGWTGQNCSVCVPYPNCKHGSCARGRPFTCECDRNWGGPLCDQDLDVCGRSEPCRNNGVCRNTSPDHYECICGEGFFGRNCQLDEETRKTFKPCAPKDGKPMCENDGICQEIRDGTDFRCKCINGWLGETCSNGTLANSRCAGDPCLNGGSCFRNGRGEAVCSCLPGWTGHHCQFDIDECDELEPCLNGATCTNQMGGYSCSCSSGWEGQNCSRPADSCHKFRCLNGGTCLSFRGHWQCQCREGFSGRQCETKKHLCEPNPCNGGSCVALPNHQHKCTACPENRFGRNCEKSASAIHPITKLEYDGCLVGVRSAISDRVDFILTRICGPHGQCTTSTDENRAPGDFTCECNPGYSGEACHINDNDCASSPCADGSTCIDLVNSFRCVCRPGFTGELCNEAVDACASSPCVDGECTSHGADFMCACSQGFKGRYCNLTTSHCDETSCDNGGSCQDIGSAYLCVCPPDFVGHRCQNTARQPCATRPCMNGATCINVESEQYQCACQEGFTGPLCEHNINDCPQATCFNNGTCIDGINRFQCQCLPGYSGVDCRLDIDECSSNPCNGGGTCVDLVNQFRCICPPNRTGLTCEVLLVQSSQSSCFYGGRRHQKEEIWNEDTECSVCRCYEDGQVFCDRGVCELNECDPADPFGSCRKSDEQCFSTEGEVCFLPPCKPHAECRPRPDLNRVNPLSFNSECGPEVTSGCVAILGLNFTAASDLSGYTVDAICAHIRRILASPHVEGLQVGCLARSHTEYEVLIDAKQPQQRLGAALEAERLTRIIQGGRTNSSALNAVRAVSLNRAAEFKELAKAQMWVTAFSLSIAVLIFLLLCAVLFCVIKIIAYQRSQHPSVALSKTRFPENPNSLNNLRIPIINNLTNEVDAADSRGKILNTAVTQEMEEFAQKATNSRTPSKAVKIPQIPRRDGVNLRYECCPTKGQKNRAEGEGALDEVVWC